MPNQIHTGQHFEWSFADGRNSAESPVSCLWISISGFESLGGSQIRINKLQITEGLVDSRAPPRGLVFSEHVVKIADQ